MNVEGTRPVWLGIDCSGNHRMWRPLEQRSNIYIAELQMYSSKSTRLSRAKSPA